MNKTYHAFFLLVAIVHSNILLAQTWFEDISNEVGIDPFPVKTDFGAGVNLIDIDQNGFLDIFHLSEDASQNSIYYNNGNSWQKITLDPSNTTISRNAIWFDFNGDHLLDVFILGDCPSRDRCIDTEVFHLYQAVDNGGFVDVTNQSGITNNRSLSSNGFDNVGGGVAVGDLNLDGYLDLIATRWNGQVYLFINNGNGTFSNESELLDESIARAYYQPIVFDFNEDGWPDIYLAVDFNDPNKLWINKDGSRFVEVASDTGLDHKEDDMGVAIGDYDNDGDYDIYVTNIQSSNSNANSFFQNLSSGEVLSFNEIANELEVQLAGWAWGTTFLDVNNDSFLDLAVTNGWTGVAVDDFSDDRSRLWLNEKGNFLDVSSTVNFNDTLDARALVAGDFDRDGDVDMIQSLAENSPLGTNIRILTNTLSRSDSTNFLIVKPRMAGQNHWAIGSNVEIFVGAKYQQRPILGGNSFYGQEPAEALFGLYDDSKVDSLIITWPGGQKTKEYEVSANTIIEISDQGIIHTPTRLIGTQNSNEKLTMLWSHIISSQKEYEIERSEDSTFSSSTHLFITNIKRLEDTTIVVPTEYFYRVRARNKDFISDWSIPVNVKTSRVLNSPQSLAAKLTHSLEVSLTWEDTEDFETGFVLERALNPGFEKALEFEIEKNSTLFIDRSVEPKSTYYYRILAKNEEVNSGYSNTVSILTGTIITGIQTNDPVILYPNPVEGELMVKLIGSYPNDVDLTI